jgi:hypothetical protein
MSEEKHNVLRGDPGKKPSSKEMQCRNNKGTFEERTAQVNVSFQDRYKLAETVSHVDPVELHHKLHSYILSNPAIETKALLQILETKPLDEKQIARQKKLLSLQSVIAEYSFELASIDPLINLIVGYATSPVYDLSPVFYWHQGDSSHQMKWNGTLDGKEKLFNGRNCYASVPSSDVLTLGMTQTVMIWFKLKRNASDWVRLIGKGNVENRNYGLWLSAHRKPLYQFVGNNGG